MALNAFKVETKTLKQISDILYKHGPDGKKVLQDTIAKSIQHLWDENFSTIHIDNQMLADLVGHEGPYTIIRKHPSSNGLSDGLYEIEGCPILIPVSWVHQNKKRKINIGTAVLVVASLVQSIFIAYPTIRNAASYILNKSSP